MSSLKNFSIAGRSIGEQAAPYVIAEMSANHNGKIENAFDIIRMAKQSGADAVKIQTYKPDTITMDIDSPEFQISGGLWDGQSLYQLYQQAHMPWEWHQPLFEFAQQQGITIFSSPFDFTAVDLLEDLNAPAYKIASFEAVDLPLIKYAASTGKPLIISTGMADQEEIQEAVEAAYEAGCSQLALLHCVSGYPAPAEDYNLRTIVDMKSRFQVPVGLSDHTLDNTTAITSVALGACIIEKHVTLDRSAGGPDDSFSLEGHELKNLCQSSKTAWNSLGSVNYARKSSEQGNVQFRRSIYFERDCAAGHVISAEDIRTVRPGYGLKPKHWEQLIGKKLKSAVSKGQATSWDCFE